MENSRKNNANRGNRPADYKYEINHWATHTYKLLPNVEITTVMSPEKER